MKEIISSNKAPAAIGPYSQGVKAGGFFFASGQIPLDPDTGLVVKGGIAEQTRQVLENIKGILEAAGLAFSDIVKTTVFLQNLEDFGAMNEVYSQYFSANPPARSTVQVARLPKDVMVEIEITALL